MPLETWLAFCTIAFFAAAVPGPAILLVCTHSIQFGLLRSLLTALGNISGLLVMSACSILGLTTLVNFSASAFTVIKIAGAIYLFYLGIKLWRSGIEFNAVETQQSNSFKPWKLYSQGLLIALTNPKAIIFTSALFPQFISMSQPLLGQFAILVSTLMSCSLLCLFCYALMSHKLRSGANRYISKTTLGKVFGSTFIGIGGALAISSRS